MIARARRIRKAVAPSTRCFRVCLRPPGESGNPLGGRADTSGFACRARPGRTGRRALPTQGLRQLALAMNLGKALGAVRPPGGKRGRPAAAAAAARWLCHRAGGKTAKPLGQPANACNLRHRHGGKRRKGPGFATPGAEYATLATCHLPLGTWQFLPRATAILATWQCFALSQPCNWATCQLGNLATWQLGNSATRQLANCHLAALPPGSLATCQPLPPASLATRQPRHLGRTRGPWTR